MSTIIFALLWFLPAGIANMIPIFAAKLPWLNHWNTPIDLGRTWRGNRLLGDHKTVRGLVTGTIIGTLAAYYLYHSAFPIFTTSWFRGGLIPQLSHQGSGVAYLDSVNPFLLGFLLSFGALVGDMVESFCKRQFAAVPSGKSWFPWDQLDYIIGAIALSLLYIQLPWYLYLITLVLYFGLHLLFSYIGYLLHLKSDPI